MPEQQYPPLPNTGGALTVPRQLLRWLDVNKQNGPLKRIEKYVTLPAFEIADRWDGYSDIVTAFNFEAPNNFSIKPRYVVPDSPNYVLCISYHVGGVITRYLLWDASGSNLNMDIPAYSGQPILKNFRLEVWNTSQGASSSSAAIIFYSSKRGDYDYRYATDQVFQASDPQVLDFWADSYGTTELVPPGSLWLDLGFGVNIPAFQIGVSPGISYTFASGSLGIVRVVKSLDGVVMTTVASPGDPPFVGSAPVGDVYYKYYLFVWTPPGPVAGDQIVEVVTSAETNRFVVPITFPANAISVTN